MAAVFNFDWNWALIGSWMYRKWTKKFRSQATLACEPMNWRSPPVTCHTWWTYGRNDRVHQTSWECKIFVWPPHGGQTMVCLAHSTGPSFGIGSQGSIGAHTSCPCTHCRPLMIRPSITNADWCCCQISQLLQYLIMIAYTILWFQLYLHQHYV